MIRVTEQIYIDEADLQESFIHSGGPGGQNVNKVATAVQLRFDISHLPTDVRLRLAGRASSRGELIITARNHRTRERNREEARARLIEIIRLASIRPKQRRATRPSLASKRKRLEGKKKHAEKKQRRKIMRD